MNKVNRAKYENLVLYLCNGLGGQIEGKKKLAKLLYYVDFDHFEYDESMESVSGDSYKKWKMGPVPDTYMEIVDSLIGQGKIERVEQDLGLEYPLEIFSAKATADEDLFSNDEKMIIDRVIRKYGSLNGRQLEALTHQEAPYIATEPDQEIAYELAFYRGTDFNDLAVTR